jgi:SAM-dependent methyltransferase
VSTDEDGHVHGHEHEHVVRRSFEHQQHLFAGPNSPFAQRSGSQAWIEPLSPDMIVLDVACGAGPVAESIAGHVRQVVGIDLTPTLLALGAERCGDSGVTNVLFQEGNAEALPFMDDSFDLVFCRGALHHMAQPRTAVAEMVRVCRAGGRVVLMDIVPPDADVRDRFDHLHHLIDPSHVKSFLEPELAGLLPGGMGALTYGDTFSIRLPIEVALTDQSHTDTVLELLRADMERRGDPTGFAPADEDGQLTVTFTTCVVHGTAAGATR